MRTCSHKKGCRNVWNFQHSKIRIMSFFLMFALTFFMNFSLIHASSSLESTDVAVAVSGKVTDISGDPLIGVNIQVKGTTRGAITDFDGEDRKSVVEGTRVEVGVIRIVSNERSVSTV